jgi:hypothetical protein
MRQYSRFVPVLLFVLLANWLWTSASAFGGSNPPFDLDTSVGTSEAVVLGELHSDGTLGVTEVFKGNPKVNSTIRLSIHENTFKSVSTGIGNGATPQVVVFLDKMGSEGVYHLRNTYTGVVAFGPNDKIFAWLDEFQAHPSWTKRYFVDQLKRSVDLDEKLDALLAKPRDEERLRACLDFISKHQPWILSRNGGPTSFSWYGYGYFFSKIANASLKPCASEEMELANLLRKVVSDEDRAYVLAFIGAINCSRSLYPDVLRWVDVKVPKLPRSQAFIALSSIDPTLAAGDLSRFLTMDDPLVDEVMQSLWKCGNGNYPRVLNVAVVAPLLALAEQELMKFRSETNVNVKTLGALHGYFHPKFLPLMFEWDRDNKYTQASGNLRSVLGILSTPPAAEQLSKWWEQHKEQVLRQHDLSSRDGVRNWLQAWSETDDKMTRHVLLRLWDFEPRVLEKEILEECEGQSGAVAKQLLAELWQRKRLNAATRKAIVAKYLKLQIVELPNPFPEFPKWREIRVVSERSFPFPHNSYVSYTGEMSGERKPTITNAKGGSGGRSLEGTETLNFHSLGGSVKGRMKAALEIWEVDYGVRPPQELWRLHWDLDQNTQQAVGPTAP